MESSSIFKKCDKRIYKRCDDRVFRNGLTIAVCKTSDYNTMQSLCDFIGMMFKRDVIVHDWYWSRGRGIIKGIWPYGNLLAGFLIAACYKNDIQKGIKYIRIYHHSGKRPEIIHWRYGWVWN